MKLEYQNLLPQEFNPNSKVWIYQSNRMFSADETLKINELLANFVSEWKNHGVSLNSFASILFEQFIVLIANDTNESFGGCSVDKSVHLIKNIEQLFNVNLLDKQNLAFLINNKIQTIPLSKIDEAFENKTIDSETLYFNNTILSFYDLQNNWIIPIKESWLTNQIKVLV